MAGPDLTLALARLLSDRTLRSAFAADPIRVAGSFSLSDADTRLLCRMDSKALEQQAQALVDKRAGEVRRLVPRTWARLGADASGRFEDHAAAYWPAGHRRHPQDAVAFLRFLSRHGLPWDRLERLRLETRLSRRRRRVGVVPRIGRWHLPALYVTWRTSHGWRERLLHLGPIGPGARRRA